MVSENVLIEAQKEFISGRQGHFARKAQKYKAAISIECKGGKTANAKSVLSVLAAGIKCGDEVKFVCDGEDEQEALSATINVLKESLKD